MSIEGGPRGIEGNTELGNGASTPNFRKAYSILHRLSGIPDKHAIHTLLSLISTFEDIDTLTVWLMTPNDQLGGLSPNEAMQDSNWFKIKEALRFDATSGRIPH